MHRRPPECDLLLQTDEKRPPNLELGAGSERRTNHTPEVESQHCRPVDDVRLHLLADHLDAHRTGLFCFLGFLVLEGIWIFENRFFGENLGSAKIQRFSQFLCPRKNCPIYWKKCPIVVI